ncbi:unnamed protein product [Brassica rapa subsp. trilocularis]
MFIIFLTLLYTLTVILSMFHSQAVSFHKKKRILGRSKGCCCKYYKPKDVKRHWEHPCSFIAERLSKVEPLTIAELNENVIISEPQVLQSDIELVCTGMVTDINMEKDWYDMPGAISETSSAVTSLSGRHQETLGIKVFKGGREAT